MNTGPSLEEFQPGLKAAPTIVTDQLFIAQYTKIHTLFIYPSHARSQSMHHKAEHYNACEMGRTSWFIFTPIHNKPKNQNVAYFSIAANWLFVWW